MTDTRYCRHCDTEKPLDHFPKDATDRRSGRVGLVIRRMRCKQCVTKGVNLGRAAVDPNAVTRTCGSCSEVKPRDQFPRDQADRRRPGSWIRSSTCKQCRAQWHGEFGRLQRHQLSVDKYRALLETQEHRCAICGALDADLDRALAVDHDHGCCPSVRSCGSCVRGLLCTRCNTGIAMLGDSLATVEKAAAYLRRATHGR